MDEWKQKCADLQHELDVSSSDARANAGEVYKLKAQMEEYNETIEALRRENKNLSGRAIETIFHGIGRLPVHSFLHCQKIWKYE